MLRSLRKENQMKYLVLICGVFATVGVSAEQGGAVRTIDLRALDADGDKRVSLSEAQVTAPRLAARFSELDKDQDGYLSRAEIFQGEPMRKVKMVRIVEHEFAAADSDADGRISKAEAAQGMPIVNEFFAEMDVGGDGYVTPEEIREHAKARGPILKRVHLKASD
jgi:Ca2+-binding EF-hand superfamily protein